MQIGSAFFHGWIGVAGCFGIQKRDRVLIFADLALQIGALLGRIAEHVENLAGGGVATHLLVIILRAAQIGLHIAHGFLIGGRTTGAIQPHQLGAEAFAILRLGHHGGGHSQQNENQARKFEALRHKASHPLNQPVTSSVSSNALTRGRQECTRILTI